MRISVHGSRELQAIIAGARAMPREIRKEMRGRTKAMIDPEWRRAVAEQVSGHHTPRLASRVLGNTARAQVSDQNVMLRSAHIGRRLSGGLLPSTHYYAVEFGASPDGPTTYEATSRKGKKYQVTRATTRQLPPRNRKGYVVYPAAREVIPRLASLWIQTVVRTVHEQLERR